MKHMHRFAPSPSMVVACLALLVALGGVGYAATALPRNSVGTPQLKRNAVTSVKVKDRSLLARDFRRGQLPRGPRGLRGLTGATGAQGPPGAPNPNAANSDLLDGKDSTAFVENTGVILVAAGANEWHEFDTTDPIDITYTRNATHFTRTAIGGSIIRLDGQAPVAQYGKALRFIGAEICYSTSGANVTLSTVFVDLPKYTNSGIGSTGNQVTDTTDRTDNACRVYNAPTPVTLTEEDHVGITLSVDWGVAGQSILLGRATFIFEPTSTAVSPPTP
jgi:hypothetical protein